MKFPSYPSNRDADESTKEATATAGRCASKMTLSRETCLHRDIHHSPGGGICYLGWRLFSCTDEAVGLVSVPQGGNAFFVLSC